MVANRRTKIAAVETGLASAGPSLSEGLASRFEQDQESTPQMVSGHPGAQNRGRDSSAPSRDHRIERAFFRGGILTLENPEYRASVRQLLEPLLQQDLAGGDLTSSALGLSARSVSAFVLAREEGVIAGLAEFAMLYGEHGADVTLEKNDGDVIQPDEIVLRAEGDQAGLLGLERTGLNLLQRMSGIATAARRLQNRARHIGSPTRIVGTRKTPWGLLDKRALHLAGVGTHRLGLGDAILIKNNHLALVANSEAEAAPKAIERAWALREKAAFIEVEVRGEAAARAAAEAFRRLQKASDEEYPCVLMLDNMSSDRISAIVTMLQRDGFWDAVLIEASGGISESNLGQYLARPADGQACEPDVISIGALTHSARALDLSQRIS